MHACNEIIDAIRIISLSYVAIALGGIIIPWIFSIGDPPYVDRSSDSDHYDLYGYYPTEEELIKPIYNTETGEKL